MIPLYILSAVLMMGYAAVFTLLAEMRVSFGFSEAAIGAIAGSAFLAGFVVQLGLSRLADSGQGSLLMRLGLLMSVIGIAWMCVASSLTTWIAARVLLGFGAGMVRPALRRMAFVLNPDKAGETLGRLAAWEMVGFLIGPIMASILFEMAGIRAPFAAILVLMIVIGPWVFRVDIPGSEAPMANPVKTLIRRPAMQSCLAMGIAFYLAVGVFDAIWAVFISDMGASQIYIGVTMSLFTLPMMLIAPYAGGMASRRHVMNLLTVTMSAAMAMMVTYGYITSIWWICLPLLVHAIVDAISMPATQLAVGYASGENALAAGQGLFGAVGLLVAAVARFGSGYVYQAAGAEALWLVTAGSMAVCIVFAQWRGRGIDWRSGTGVQSTAG